MLFKWECTDMLPDVIGETCCKYANGSYLKKKSLPHNKKLIIEIKMGCESSGIKGGKFVKSAKRRD